MADNDTEAGEPDPAELRHPREPSNAAGQLHVSSFESEQGMEEHGGLPVRVERLSVCEAMPIACLPSPKAGAGAEGVQGERECKHSLRRNERVVTEEGFFAKIKGLSGEDLLLLDLEVTGIGLRAGVPASQVTALIPPSDRRASVLRALEPWQRAELLLVRAEALAAELKELAVVVKSAKQQTAVAAPGAGAGAEGAGAGAGGAHNGEGEEEGAVALLEGVESEILTFWLIRGGGGASGDAALAKEFFEHRNEVLDAPQLGARLHRVLGVQQLETAVTEQLLKRLLSASACGAPALLSVEALLAWVHTAYPLFELEQMLLSDAVRFHKILARHLVQGNGKEARTREEVEARIHAAASDLADSVYGQIAQLEEARRAAQTGSANGKFAGDDVGGTFEGKFASAQAFHGGLDRHLGLPDAKVLEAIINEHKHGANADTPYTTSNYNLTCTPSEELEAALCPVPGKEYPGAGSGEREREIRPLKVFLKAAGCLRPERWADPTCAATLKKLEAVCGPLELNEEDKVHEAMSLLMMAKQSFSATIKAVKCDLAKRCEGDSGSLNLDMLYEAMAFVKGWDSATTLKHMERGRALFLKADLWPEEVLGARLYTGPQFMQYNASLREFPQWVLDTMLGNRYVTTIHCINSAIIKLARASPIDPLEVYRGSIGMCLPRQFAAKDDLGRQGDVELAFMSCTSKKSVALNYAAGGNMPLLLCFARGAMNNGAPLSAFSFYFIEEEICLPPLCNLEVKGKPQILFTNKGAVLQVSMVVTVNQKAETIDGLVGRRKFLHEGMLRNLVQEVESELKVVDALLGTLSSLALEAEDYGAGRTKVAPGVAASSERDYIYIALSIAGSAPEQALADFARKARQTCERTLTEQDKPAAEFNDDDTYSALVNEAVNMKTRALEGQYHLLCKWFSHCAKADVRALGAVVRQLDVNMWSDTRVVDEGTGETPLMAACSAGSLELCEALIKARVDASAVDKAGNTSVWLAVEQKHEAVVELLLQAMIEAGIDIDARYEGNARDKQGQTVLMRASAHGLTSTVAKLLALGADVSAKDENGKGALMMAAKEGLEDLVCLLVESHAEVDGCDDKGKTALHYASERGHAHVVKVLLKIGADIEATDKVSQSES